MADWTYGTSRDEHLDEHNQFDHTDLASLTEGRVLGVSGGIIKQVASMSLAAKKTASYVVVSGDTEILVDSTAAPVTITLPAATAFNGQAILVKRIAGTNAVTINRVGSDLINIDGVTATFKTLNSLGAHWAAIAIGGDARWYTIGVYGTVI